jgi:peptidoglycan/xylan/chitin deacetylase (PgdA/CDA1 family)
VLEFRDDRTPPAMTCTAVMYHYVRDTAGTRFPGFAALSIDAFVRQLDDLQARFRIVGIGEMGATNASPTAVLTFDDGYLDHYTTVFPILEERNLRGAFYPIAMPDGPKLADVNRIHVLLASAPSMDAVLAALKEILAESSVPGCDFETLWGLFGKPGRFDRAEVHFVKRTLQRGLPQPLRSRVVAELFERFADVSEEALAAEFYATPAQLREMRSRGHHIGIHTCRHDWLDTMSAPEVTEELRRSLAWLEDEDLRVGPVSIAYPYGGFNETVIACSDAVGIEIGWTTQSRVADLSRDRRLALPRIDTNEVPFLH